MSFPNTTVNHNFGQSTASNGPNVIAVTLGAAQALTLTTAGGRVLAVSAGAGASVVLPDPTECTGQTRTLINTGSNAFLVTRGGTTIATVSAAPADRGVVSATAPSVVTVLSNGTAWSCIGSGNAPANAFA